MKPLRTRFAKDIVAEFLPPARPSAKVILFLSGMPSMPKIPATLEFYAKKGFWVFHPRYRGSWESGGSFLQYSPTKDALDIINQLPKGFKDLQSGKSYKIQPKELYLFGSSFGGPAALLNSNDKRVTKTVTLSPVIDWQAPSKDEPLDWLGKYIPKAYGNGYRMKQKNWDKLKTGNFYNPIREAKKINGEKILIFQAKDDASVYYRPAEIFSKETGAKLLLYKRGGHFGSSFFSDPLFYKEIKKFIK